MSPDNGNQSPNAIEVRGLKHRFGRQEVLRGVELDVPAGQITTIVGPSGCGKTVLLKHLNLLMRPDAGTIRIDGIDVTGLGSRALDTVREKFGMLFQAGALFDSLTVYGNVSYPLREHGWNDEDAIARRSAEVLEMVELRDADRLYPAELSGGMRKRVALARALALQPRAVLYDEPATGLDPLVTHRINLMIRSLQKQLGFTSVVVTHDLRSAFMVGDRFALLDHGRIRFSGTADQVRTTGDELMREFVSTAL